MLLLRNGKYSFSEHPINIAPHMYIVEAEISRNSQLPLYFT